MTFTASNEKVNPVTTDGTALCPATDAYGNPAKLTAFGGTPVSQPTSSGYATLQTAGSTTALYANSATTGGVGTTQYTFGDLVAALKALNLIKN